MKGEAMKALKSEESSQPVGAALGPSGDQGEVDDFHDVWRRVPF
jgi:hypothetical protein